MDDQIHLKEHQEREIVLSPQEVTTIRQHLSGVLRIWPTEEQGRYILGAGSTVGFAALPSGRTVFIEQKVPIETLFALLAAVYDLPSDVFRDEPQSYTTVAALFEFLVGIFTTQVEDLLARGILRGYKPHSEDTPAIRGRLLFAESLRHRPALRDRHWCTYTHFTPDVAENRILHWAAFCLQHLNYRDQVLPARLRRIGRSLADVKLDPRARELFAQLHFHRLNDPYRSHLALARLLLDHLALSGTAGEEPFLAYLVDMNWLFESYVLTLLQRTAQELGVQFDRKASWPLDRARSVTVIPDAILCGSDGPALVVDAKYKRDEAQPDIYQVLAYCHALNIAEAALVHPATEQSPSGSIRLRGPGDVQVHYLSLDLRGDPAELEVRAKTFERQVANLLAEQR